MFKSWKDNNLLRESTGVKWTKLAPGENVRGSFDKVFDIPSDHPQYVAQGYPVITDTWTDSEGTKRPKGYRDARGRYHSPRYARFHIMDLMHGTVDFNTLSAAKEYAEAHPFDKYERDEQGRWTFPGEERHSRWF